MPPHYKKQILLSIVERLLPSGSEGWKLVAQEYQKESDESTTPIANATTANSEAVNDFENMKNFSGKILKEKTKRKF